MLDGKGYLKGSAILVSGMVGTGKSSLAAHFVEAGSRRGQRCLYFAFEEAPSQIMRNMRSIGIDLEPWVKKGLLRLEGRNYVVQNGDVITIIAYLIFLQI
jgi:circadian clock protein KaiC